MKKIPLFVFTLLFLMQCMPVKEEKLTEIRLDLKDPVLQTIYDFQDQRKTDSLLVFFDHKDPTYRYAAAMGMGSVQDEEAIEDLAILLNDEVEEVRIAAAYALGQTGAEKAETFLINAFDTLNTDQFNKVILEAIGKCGPASLLESIATAAGYYRKDTLLLEGQAWGIYRYALRGKVHPAGTDRMIKFVSENGYPKSVRFIAANYLSRARQIQLDSFSAPLILAIGRTDDPRTEMALAIALGKTKTQESLQTLKSRYRIATDYRVKCNILRALTNYEYDKVKDVVLGGVKDPNSNVALSACQYLIEKGFPQEAVDYWKMAKDTGYVWPVRMALYQAANKHLPPYFENTKNRMNQELRDIITQSQNIYERAAAIKGLGEFGWNYRFIIRTGLESSNPVIRTASAESIVHILRYPNFDSWFGLGSRRVKRELTDFLTKAVNSGDVGMMYVAAEAFADKQLEFSAIVDTTDFLLNALNDLSLPRDIETYNAVQKAYDVLNGNTVKEPKKPDFNNPIDWNFVNSLSEETRAVIVTSKGNITLRFFLKEAPASAANFIRLARAGYYDGKQVHRVVPNFVIQDGCPRGDGFGGADFSIRSELPMMYYSKAGFVGMASAGNDTEGTQWFITHSPTPHLDGRYTIFAEVADGQDVVDQITIGDRIDKIVISK